MDERVIFVPFIRAFGGVERLLLGLSRWLNDEGIAHRIVCFRDTIGLQRYAAWPLALSEIRAVRNPFVEAMALRRELGRLSVSDKNPALVFDLKGAFYAGLSGHPFHSHLTDPPSLLGSDITKDAPSARVAMGMDPTVGPGGRAPALRAELVHRVTRITVRQARSVTAMTEHIAAELNALYDVTPTVLRPGVAPTVDGLRIKQRTSDTPVRLLSVSRLESSKRLSWILRAVAELEGAPHPWSESVDWRLDIVGEGTCGSKLREMTRELGLGGRVQFLGQVPDARLEEVYREASLFLMPAVQGWGLPALEALMRGVPVVLHEQSGVAEILGGNLWVEFIRDHDGRDFASAIERMVVRIQSGRLATEVPPRVPTEAEWAAALARQCGWAPRPISS